jgi:hypothetical protein
VILDLNAQGEREECLYDRDVNQGFQKILPEILEGEKKEEDDRSKDNIGDGFLEHHGFQKKVLCMFSHRRPLCLLNKV